MSTPSILSQICKISIHILTYLNIFNSPQMAAEIKEEKTRNSKRTNSDVT